MRMEEEQERQKAEAEAARAVAEARRLEEQERRKVQEEKANKGMHSLLSNDSLLHRRSPLGQDAPTTSRRKRKRTFG